jgi:DNA-binding SARP family transcriptional activator
MTHPPAAAPSPSHFDVLILGSFALYRDGSPIDVGTWQRKVQSLLRILVTSPDRRRTRDDLVELLWPETSSEAGFRNLRVVLHMLRRGLGAGDVPVIVSEWGWIALNPAHEWDLDLDRFEESAAAGSDIAALEVAAGYYRGEPLSEDRYEDWAVAIRARVQRSWRDLCLRLAELHHHAGAPDAAVRWLERIVESDPLDEEALHGLLRNLGDLDRRAEALRRYQLYSRRLKDELDLEPGREIQALVAELRKASDVTAPVLAPVPDLAHARVVPVIPRSMALSPTVLVGREQELGRILWAMPPMHETSPRLVMVAGELGVGKTRLLAEVAERARKAGLLTLAGGCHRYEGEIQYGPIRDALAEYVESQPESTVRTQLEGLADVLCRIVPELSLRFGDVRDLGRSSDDPRLLLFLTVVKTLERIANETPLVLLLDDLQWADTSTLQLLHFLVRQASGNRLLLVGAYGAGDADDLPVSGVTADLESAGWASQIRLAPLTPDELTGLLEHAMRGRCSGGLSASVYAQSGGNPSTALQLVHAWQREVRLLRAEGEWRLTNPPLTPPNRIDEALA